eukprot:scaffold82132_cov22-Tisochrysis_lutea.AAC.1
MKSLSPSEAKLADCSLRSLGPDGGTKLYASAWRSGHTDRQATKPKLGTRARGTRSHTCTGRTKTRPCKFLTRKHPVAWAHGH